MGAEHKGQLVTAGSILPTCPNCGERMDFTAPTMIPLASLRDLRFTCASCGDAVHDESGADSRC